MPSTETYKAIVEKIVTRGEHGPYAVSRNTELGSITFSLDHPVWQEDERPEPGSIVVLSQITKKRAGWRASRSRFFKPSDEK